jgi:hypothetical protein
MHLAAHGHHILSIGSPDQNLGDTTLIQTMANFIVVAISISKQKKFCIYLE